MIGALWNGVIGIATFDRAMGVESNNVTNATTVGHKADEITFEDLMYRDGFGKGVAIQTINKNFSQGGIKLTNVDLDVAIEGKGFFITKERITGDTYYSRAGNFQQAEDGFLENQDKMKILGLSPQIKNVVSTSPADTMFTNDFSRNMVSTNVYFNETVMNINTRVSDYNSLATSDNSTGSNSKTASSKINDVDYLRKNYLDKLALFQTTPSNTSVPSTSQISNVDFSSSLSELNDVNDSISITLNGNTYRQYFDTDLQTTLNKFSDKLSNSEGFTSSIDTTTGMLTIEGMVPGKSFKINDAKINNNFLNSINTQEAVSGSGLAMIDSARTAFKNAVETANAKFLEITNTLSFSDKSVIGNDEINLRLNSLGLMEDAKGKVSISDDGLVFVTEGDNKFLVSKIQTAHFRNEQGLKAVGTNTFKITEESGRALNADNLNKLISTALENANVSYSSTLSTLLFYQKAFEANSKSISTSDEFIKTAIDMKK